MNRSGESVVQTCRFFRIQTTSQLIVVADDLDLPPGQIRIRSGGGSGGNRGLMSVIDALQTENFPRLRIGIGRDDLSATDHVLSTIPDDQRELFDKAIVKAADALEIVTKEGLERAMNQFNRKDGDQ